MNIAQMQLEFRQEYDDIDSSSLPNLLPEQIDYFLNTEILEFIKQRSLGTVTSDPKKRRGLEEIQKRTDDLFTLIKTNFTAISTVSYEVNTYQLNLSSLFTDSTHSTPSTDVYMFYERGRVEVTKTGCGSSYQDLYLTTHDKVSKLMKNPLKRADLLNPIGYFENGNLYVITDGTYTITNSKITFIKKPAIVQYGTQYVPTPTLDVSCDLPEQTHKEIIKMAVASALEVVRSERFQTSMLKNTMIE